MHRKGNKAIFNAAHKSSRENLVNHDRVKSLRAHPAVWTDFSLSKKCVKSDGKMMQQKWLQNACKSDGKWCANAVKCGRCRAQINQIWLQLRSLSPPALMVAFWSHFCTSHLAATTYVISSQPHGLNFEISGKLLIQDCRKTLGLPLELTPIILG